MMCLESVSGMSLLRGRLITDRQDVRHWQPAECRFQARLPSHSVTLIAIALQHDESRNWFNGHQKNLGMKRLILASRALPLSQLRGQLLGAAIFVVMFRDTGCISRLAAERTADDTIPLREFPKASDVPQVAVAVEFEDQMQREHNSLQRPDTGRAFPEVCDFGLQWELLSSLNPVLQ